MGYVRRTGRMGLVGRVGHVARMGLMGLIGLEGLVGPWGELSFLPLPMPPVGISVPMSPLPVGDFFRSPFLRCPWGGNFVPPCLCPRGVWVEFLHSLQEAGPARTRAQAWDALQPKAPRGVPWEQSRSSSSGLQKDLTAYPSEGLPDLRR